MLLIRSLGFLLGRLSPMRFIGPSATLIGLIALGFFAVTGKLDFATFDLPLDAATDLVSTDAAKAEPTTARQPLGLDRNSPRPNQRIRVATFNIQQFGEKKSANADVMNQLASIVANFDLIAIQEVRDPQAMPVARLVDLINRSGARYDASVSPPVGHTDDRQQYAFVWDSTRIRMIPDSAYVVRDDARRMHRPPMVASFETRIQPVAERQPFRFTVINAQTNPAEVSSNGELNEMNVLDDVFIRVREYEYQGRQIMNVLLVGDLNVSSANLGELGQIAGIVSVVGTTPTNTAGTKTGDHLLLDRNVTTEYTGVFGVVDYQRDFEFTPEQAKMLSDHRPVWAEFSAYEMPPRSTASRTATLR